MINFAYIRSTQNSICNAELQFSNLSDGVPGVNCVHHSIWASTRLN